MLIESAESQNPKEYETLYREREEDGDLQKALDYIKDNKQMEFAIFCIENIASGTGLPAEKVYDLLVTGSILQKYIVPNYEMLHAQGKDYIADDILDVMKEKGAAI